MLSLNGNIIWTVVNLLILYFLLKRFLFRPVTAIMEQRKKLIEEELRSASKGKEEAELLLAKLEQNREEKEKMADRQITIRTKQRLQRAEEEGRQLLARARSEADQVIESGRRQAVKDKEKALAEAKSQIAEISMAAAKKIAGIYPNEIEDKKLLQNLIKKAGEDYEG